MEREVRQRKKGKGEKGEEDMAVMVLDPYVEAQVLAKRQACDGEQYDEVWEGVYVMSPLPSNEHQQLVHRLSRILDILVDEPGRGLVFPGVNLSDRSDGWERNFREPDVAVFLRSGRAVDCGTHWRGAADFLVEIISPGERTRDKIPFYSSLGVVELLIIDRDPWTLEFYRHQNGRLEKIGQSTLASPDVLESNTVGLGFQLLPGPQRPQVQVTHLASGRQWQV
jgi:Uma2 family endonuclease